MYNKGEKLWLNGNLQSTLFMQKKDIDSMMYIDENLFKIPMPLRKEYVDRIRDHFYINCCVVVDAFLDKNKIEK